MESKKQYVEPKLVEYGKVEELTQSSSVTGTPDAFFYQTSGTNPITSAQNS